MAKDLNDDGLAEIVTADRGDLNDLREQRPANDELSLLVAQPDGSYVKHHPSLKSDFGPYDVAIANIDALKWPDIIVVNFHAVRHQNVFLYLNLKQEDIFNALPFRIPDEGLPYLRHRDGDGIPLYSVPGLTALTIQDVNHDGLRDLLASGWSSDVLVFLPGHAEKFFDETAVTFTKAAGGPCALEAADFDKDGEIDLAVAMKASEEVTLWRGNGQGGFEEKNRFLSRGHLPNRIKARDINRDGYLDLAVSHPYAEDSVLLFYGDGNFTFSISQEIQLGEDLQVLEHEIHDIVLDDLNGDGRMDLAAACNASQKVIVYLNESAEGSRLQSFRRESYSFEEGRPSALCSADVDNNQRQDLIVALWDVNGVVVLMNGK
ncbi:MAG: VCBS repeat-containing protein [Candidatus Hydrogenedentes bacterium]|nr:VCBS repeat-containing protein [Candidatus Hydrogenedentota bacterium]